MSMKTESRGLNVAMLGHKRIPSREGGVEIVVEELAVRMVKLGHSVTCYNRKGHHVSGAEFDNDARFVQKDGQIYYKGVRLKKVFTIQKKGFAAATSSIVGTFHAAFGKYDVVHFHAEGPAFMCWLPKLFGKRIIVTVHGLDHQRAKWSKFASSYIMAGEQNAVRHADEIIVLSDGVKQYFKDTYGRETVFIPNGVSKPKIVPPDEIIKRFGLQKDEYVLFLGRIVPEKGLRYLANAWQKVKTDKKLVIAGGSSDTERFMEELKEICKDNDSVIFTGFVQGKPLEELYSNAYIYTLPSDLEGMPLSLLEAMSYGNCCLTSDIAECAEVVEDKAVLFHKSDENDLCEKLQMLCDNPDIVKKYKESASDFICKKYNWDYVVEETLRLYKKSN